MAKQWSLKGKITYPAYKYLHEVSRYTNELAIKDKDHQANYLIISMLFSALALEAFLNHIGNILFSKWADLDMLKHREKLTIISDKLNYQIDFGRRPWQTYEEIFSLRNRLVHAKTEIVDLDFPIIEEGDEFQLPSASWQKELTHLQCQKFIDDTVDMCIDLAKNASIPTDELFSIPTIASLISIEKLVLLEDAPNQANH